jgi:hypothetical protein
LRSFHPVVIIVTVGHASDEPETMSHSSRSADDAPWPAEWEPAPTPEIEDPAGRRFTWRAATARSYEIVDASGAVVGTGRMKGLSGYHEITTGTGTYSIPGVLGRHVTNSADDSTLMTLKGTFLSLGFTRIVGSDGRVLNVRFPGWLSDGATQILDDRDEPVMSIRWISTGGFASPKGEAIVPRGANCGDDPALLVAVAFQILESHRLPTGG